MYEKLKRVQKLLWEDGDCIDQESLYEIQELIAEITLESAKVEHRVPDLIKTFPYIYEAE